MNRKPKDIALQFFKNQVDDSYLCYCGTIIKQRKNHGYSNLLHHLNNAHPTYESLLIDDNNQKSITSFYNKDATWIFSWIELIVMENLPLSICESAYFRKYIGLDSISTSTLKKYINTLFSHLRNVFKTKLPKAFGLIFDGWTFDSTHYVALIAIFPNVTSNVAEKILLSIAPLFDETSLSAENHKEYVEEILKEYGRSLSNVLFLCGDNCNLNIAISSSTNIPLIGCASHRLHLATEKIFTHYEHLLSRVEKLMKKLRTIKAWGLLKAHTDLHPIIRCKTRWLSTYEMLDRYLNLYPIVKRVFFLSADIYHIIPTDEEHYALVQLKETLTMFESVNKALQQETTTLLDIRLLFDSLIRRNNNLTKYLSQDSDIIMHKNFENAIVKIIEGKETALTEPEKYIMQPFLLPDSAITNCNENVNDSSNAAEDYATEIIRAAKRQRTTIHYQNLNYIPGTSNSVERLFSIARHTIGLSRHSLASETLETLLFLKFNKNYWDISTIANMISQQKDT